MRTWEYRYYNKSTQNVYQKYETITILEVNYNMPYTNKSIECWHNSLTSNLNEIHPSLCKFIDIEKIKETKPS